MNRAHLDYLASPQWAQALRNELLPWLERVADLGDDVLEIGPGPGLTTDLLRERVATVTAVEIDDDLARALQLRLAGTNVEVIHGDGTALDLASERFSAATCFSMLHHVASSQAQDQLFTELARVLRPGGSVIGVDSLDSETIRTAHLDDVFVPVDPNALAGRLEAAGFSNVIVAPSGDHQFRFHAIKAG